MANDFDNTAVNSTVKELWDEKLEEARYRKGVLISHLANRTDIAKKKGDIIHVTIDQRWTVGTVGADGTFTPQNYTLSTQDVTLNQWNQISFRVLDRAEAQSFWTPDSIFPRKAGEAFAEYYDIQVAGLQSSLTTNPVGDLVSPGNFDKNMAQEAMLAISLSNVPEEDLFWVLHKSAYFRGLFNEYQLTSAESAGTPKSLIRQGYITQLLNAPVYLTNAIVSAGTPAVRKNMLLHPSAICVAFQKNVTIDQQSTVGAGVAGWMHLAQSLWGYSVIRSDHAIICNSKA